jgi:hypothetical protein
MVETTLPKATHDGDLRIAERALPCAVLENGQRVLTQDGFLRSIGRLARGGGGQGALAEKLPVFLRAQNLRPYISDDIEMASIPIIFRTRRGKQAFGYRAELLPVVCDIFLKARADGVLSKTQEHIAQACEVLVRGLATVGIIALVDEATGYQDYRARQALEQILDKFIRNELGKWAKTFPDEFYREMFRLRGWAYDPRSVKRPGVIGRYTEDLVYKRLAPGVLEELKLKNPPIKGHRKHRHFQWLTEDVGHPRLREHLAAVIALMKASSSWRSFYGLMQRALPQYGETIEMFPELWGKEDNDA